ncbi:MAG: NAD(P)/FAD-dependent oxidoreductase [Candidatus Eisenbacteria bacterium]|uniref:NAD(P)/FAD-dependent oxidoreductase n=1 Tax=Eiseniibacteriota bacterium TaxID=2212470 RepID=A0A7Y2EAL0_UNCEI|nr:NAD(P)/FAD-dependent oxidoreductase [Candidatus Eisenbacteria bacterium]
MTNAKVEKPWDVVVVGAGAAGLMAAIQAGRAKKETSRVLLLDGAKKIGAKILVSGGGRCNVTHYKVDESSFFGGSPKAIRKVLRRFDVADTSSFFSEAGVELKQEETGKLFPVSDSAQSVLGALVREANAAGVSLRNPWRVQRMSKSEQGFKIESDTGETVLAHRVILATGGKSIPKSGSDGFGYSLAQSFGHTITDRVFPALVPLLLKKKNPLLDLSGVSFPGRLSVQVGNRKPLFSCRGSVLCTHFGLSGPAVLDISRHYLAAAFDEEPDLRLSFVPGEEDTIESELLGLGTRSVGSFLRIVLPERLARVVCTLADVDPDTRGSELKRDQRKALLQTLTNYAIPVAGDRGFRFAEVTAGGVPLGEVRLNTMESRACPGLYLCGEICDVDGRIGGFNFQWAWASGFVAGRASVSD